jgi:threonine dehydratase
VTIVWNPTPVITLSDVEAAAARLEGIVHRTPVLTSRTLDARTGAAVHLKAECFQRGGSFKLRGAYNRIATLDPAERARGVVATSSGNHAQAVAIAAGLVGVPATIVMPADTPAAKLEATRGYGAEIVTYDRYADDRDRLTTELAEERGLPLVLPFDDPFVMAGQGTAALELIADAGPLDVLVVPVGGGGLIAGCATAAKALRPGTRVVGVEPEAADDTKRSLAEGRRVGGAVARTIADALQSPIPGRLTFEVTRTLVDEIALVSDAELVAAMAFLFDRLKIVTEPGGAAAVAALLAGRVDLEGLRVGAIVSGGNVGVARFCELIDTR